MNQEDNIDARRLYDPKATRTVYFGNLDARIDTELLYEIAIQAGPVKRISLPPSKGYGFVEYESIQVAQYAVNLFCRGVKVYGKSLLVNFAVKQTY